MPSDTGKHKPHAVPYLTDNKLEPVVVYLYPLTSDHGAPKEETADTKE